MVKPTEVGLSTRCSRAPQSSPAPCPPHRPILIGTRMQTEFPVSYRKERAGIHFNRYTKTVHHASRLLVLGSRPLASISEINRDNELLESPVSHCKQRPPTPINRNISWGIPGRPGSFTNHRSQITTHGPSNRKPEFMESCLSPSKSTTPPVLTANFEPNSLVRVPNPSQRCTPFQGFTQWPLTPAFGRYSFRDNSPNGNQPPCTSGSSTHGCPQLYSQPKADGK